LLAARPDKAQKILANIRNNGQYACLQDAQVVDV
jgi:hypothetical protein